MRKIAVVIVILVLAGVAFGQRAQLKAQFTIAPLIPEAKETVQFIDQSTGPVASRYWQFGDGKVSRQKNPTHAYAKEGFYKATLTVRGIGGRVLSFQLTVMVIPPMVADFSWLPKLPVETLPIQFTDDSTGLDIVRWFWDFGDGGFSTEQHPVHTYAKAGAYTVTLRSGTPKALSRKSP